jgi:3-oxoacyl-[acyl-carrier-protein] synthase II
MHEPIYITGMGICSPLGNDLATVAGELAAGRSGVAPIQSFDCTRLIMRHAGEVKEIPHADRYPKDLYRVWDRGTRMAMHAAFEAVSDAEIDVASIDPARFGLCCGTSGSGQYQNARFNLDRSMPLDRQLVFFLSRNSPHYQASQLAALLKVKGPNVAIGAATAGSGIAIATAVSWLQSGRVDAVLVGGGESFSLLNVLGFDQLGLSLPRPCTPFHDEPGMTFGEGAGYFVLETRRHALQRNARVHAELQGVAIRADGFDPILFDPSGSGQSRAMHAALKDANLTPDQIDWIRASGTGGRDQDLAETLAVKAVFDQPPPVSSLEPYLGHANGAGPAIGLVAAVLCMQQGIIPATKGCGTPRAGCDLDYVTEGHRQTKLQHVLCNTAAFGGTNCAMIIRNTGQRGVLPSPKLPAKPRDSRFSDISTDYETDADDVVITGIGAISSLGCGDHHLAEEFHTDRFALSRDVRLYEDNADIDLEVGLVQGFSPRKHCPMVRLRGTELLTQYAAGATSLALQEAGLNTKTYHPDRVGVVSAIARPSGSIFSKLFRELQQDGFRPSIGRLMLRNGRFMIASQLANWFDFRGYSSTLSLGVGCGLHGLVTAYDKLKNDSSLDAIVVVACDELSAFTMQMFRRSGLLCGHQNQWKLYSQGDSGMVPGEGGVAVVVERKSFAEARGANPLARIRGCGLTFDGLSGAVANSKHWRSSWESVDTSGEMMSRCIDVACKQAKTNPKDVDLVMGNGTGVWDWDRKELNGLQRVFGSKFQPTCVNGKLGLAEGASALFNLLSAVSALNTQRVPSPKRIPERAVYAGGTGTQVLQGTRPMQRAMVVAGTEHGHNASVILEACAKPRRTPQPRFTTIP